MGKKFIPNGDLDFAVKAESFARTLLEGLERFCVPRDEAEELDVAVKNYRAALQTARFGGGRSQAATAAKEAARHVAEQNMRRIGHLVRSNKRLDVPTKVLLGLDERTARPKATPCPQEPPRLEFNRAIHERGATPMHELKFRAYDSSRAKPEGAVRLELFVDLIAPDEPVPSHPGANHGGRPWYLCSYTKSPIVIAPPMPKVPMRVLYWGRWAGSGSGPENVGPFSATAAGWIEGGTHNYLPGGLALQMGDFGRNQQKLIDAHPKLPAEREQHYSVAVLEAQYQSFQSFPAPEHEPRQLEGPVDPSEEAA